MSEQIREQVSAFLDGELPDSETELLLKRLTRDPELRHSFGRYALIGETLRGGESSRVTRDFAARVNCAIDGEPVAPAPTGLRARQPSWWRPIAGTAVAASVAALAVVALQQRAVAPGTSPLTAASPQNVAAPQLREAISYTVPAAGNGETPVVPAARFTSYVFAHSKYSTGLGQGSLLSGLLTDADEQLPDSRASAAAAKAAVGAEVPARRQVSRSAP